MDSKRDTVRAFQIPTSHAKALGELAGLSEEDFATLLAVLTEEMRTIDCSAVGASIAAVGLFDETDARALMDLITELSSVRHATRECPPSHRCQSRLRPVETQHLLEKIDLLFPSRSQPPDELQKRFDELARNWKEGTLVMSSSPQIYAHDAYRQIVDLGEQVLPFIFDELRRSNDIHWIQALVEISDFRHPKSGATPDEVIQAWLRWGNARGLVS
ncbi:MAG: hypothetical protein KTV16_16815 [Acidimicrobiia bacterium]|nr:hypothetical protein [Acidimicrobiia bacterium]